MKSIIMAGGAGTRLWPLSTLETPKQFITLKGQKFSLFQMAVQRSLLFCSLADVYILTVSKYEHIVRRQLEELAGTSSLAHIIIEPQMKNTLPAIYNAVKAIQAEGKDDVVVVSPSDHLIKNPEKLVSQIHAGYELAKEYIFTFGITPKHPDTGFGYIRAGQPLAAGFKIAEFKEKPDLKKADEYVKNGYFWNAGLFMFSTALFSKEVEAYAPEVFCAFEEQDPLEAFAKTPAISIDYGVMEKSARTAILPLDLDWDDLGVFESFYSTFSESKDKSENILLANAAILGSKGNLVYSETGRPCAVIGADNLIIVDSENGLLVCKKGQAQSVKEATSRFGKYF